MRIDHITLKNFRCFEHFELELHPSLTVLVANNGGGKTAVLDGLAVALRYFVDTVLGKKTSRGFARTDIRLIRGTLGQMSHALPTELEATGAAGGSPMSWSRSLATESGRTTYAQATDLAQHAKSLVHRLQLHLKNPSNVAPHFPAIAYYGTARLWSQARVTKGRERLATSLTDPKNAYDECLTPNSSFGNLSLWFEAISLELAQETLRESPSPHNPKARLEAVVNATNAVLAPVGWRDLHFDHLRHELAADHPDQGRLPVSLLSDGIRNIVALVADLAHRCVRLNPSLGAKAPELTDGIVLIDELDMHLHPSWQQQVVAALRTAFPKIQFVITTHSPQLISTVPNECLRLLSADGSVSTPTVQTEGDDSAAVLARVMGVDPVPTNEHTDRLSEYRALVERGDGVGENARAIRHALEQHFGAEHPVIQDLSRLQRWHQVRARLPNREG